MVRARNRDPSTRSPSILEHFAALSDPREGWRVLHPLRGILLAVLCATLCGMDDFVEVKLWGEARLGLLRRFLPFDRGIPSHDTLNDVMNGIDAELLKLCSAAWVDTLRDSRRPEPMTVLDFPGHDARLRNRSVRSNGSRRSPHIRHRPDRGSEVRTLHAPAPPGRRPTSRGTDAIPDVRGRPVPGLIGSNAMINVDDPEFIFALKETCEVECKLASGRDGRGQLPDDFWRTYSAFTNTRGGVILLGIRETGDDFEVVGLRDPDRIRTMLFDQLNNPQKVSGNVVADDDVEMHDRDGASFMSIRIAAAPRRLRPVYLNNNPMTGTYRRLHDGDRRCDAAAVKGMLAEQADSRDDLIMEGHTNQDLDPETLKAYRAAFQTARPGHVFLGYGEDDFLRAIGARKIDRESGKEGVTMAGLLMFGRYESIRDAFPDYFPDYQEHGPDAEADRWADRLSLDGNWSGNLFDFYRRVYRKLTEDLKVPFTLKGGIRMDETSIHEVLREALVNVLVHADYAGTLSLRVIKRRDGFQFRNPGLMRVPPELARRGGDGDARNKRLQQLFLLIGAAERAGSGIPKIYRNWEERHWVPPAYEQLDEPSEQTLLNLSMIDFLPRESLAWLRSEFGGVFDALGREQRLIMATAVMEGRISHARMRRDCTMHPADLTRALQGLVHDGLLIRSGRTSATTYRVADPKSWKGAVAGADAGAERGDLGTERGDLGTERGDLGAERGDLGTERGDLGAERGDLGAERGDLGAERRNLGAGHPARAETDAPTPLAHPGMTGAAPHPDAGQGARPGPIHGGPDLAQPGRDRQEGDQWGAEVRIDDLASADPILASLLRNMASETGRGRWSLDIAGGVIAKLCEGRCLTTRVLSDLLGRNEGHLRDRVLGPLVDRGIIRRTHPDTVNHPRQAYTSTKSGR